MSRLPETPTHSRERDAARNRRLMDSPQHRRTPQPGVTPADPFHVDANAPIDRQQALDRLTRLPVCALKIR